MDRASRGAATRPSQLNQRYRQSPKADRSRLRDELRDKALAANSEACEQCGGAPVAPTKSPRFALAYLGNQAADPAPFYAFWRAVTGAEEKGGQSDVPHAAKFESGSGGARYPPDAWTRAAALAREAMPAPISRPDRDAAAAFKPPRGRPALDP
jgi:hypothetical protein